MRIRDFHVENILHFDKFGLDLGPDPHGLHILYGPNEAGKSTLLRLFVDLLFGGRIADEYSAAFGTKSVLSGTLEATPDPLFGTELAATGPGSSSNAGAGTGVGSSAASISATTSGVQSSLVPSHPPLLVKRTRKGKRLVLSSDNADVTEEVLQALVGGLDRDRYALLFGFDHLRLRQGGDSLLQSGGHAGISLFEAGGGVQFLRNLSEELASRTQGLLDPSFRSNSNKDLNAAWREYKKLVNESRRSRLRGEDWHRLKDDIERTEQRIAGLQQQTRDLETRQSQLERIKRIRRFVADLLTARADWAQMQDVVELSDQLHEEIPETMERLKEIEKELSRQRGERKMRLDEMSAIAVDSDILAAADDIQGLQQRLQQYVDAQAELPGLGVKIADHDNRGQLLLRDLAPGMELKDVESLRIPYANDQLIRKLAADWQGLRRDKQTVEEAQRQVEADIQQVRDLLNQLGVDQDVTDLRRVLNAIHQAGDLDGAIAKAEHEIDERKRAADGLLKQQTVFGGSLADLSKLPIPLAETVTQYVQRYTDAEQAIADVRREIQKTNQELERFGDEIDTLELAGRVPVEADLVAARTHRDTGWDLIRRAWLKGEAMAAMDALGSDVARYLPGGATEVDAAVGAAVEPDTGAHGSESPRDLTDALAQAYEHALETADDVADWMRRESDRSARHAQLLLQKAQAERNVERLEKELADAVTAYEDLQQKWQAEWHTAQPELLSVKPPTEMRDWIANYYRPVLIELRSIESQLKSLKDLRTQRTDLVSRLAPALASGGPSTVDELRDLGLAKLGTLAQERIDEVDGVRRRRDHLNEREAELRAKVQQQRDKLAGIVAELSSVDEQWAALREQYPQLPENLMVIGAYLDKLREVFDWVKERQRLHQDARDKRQVCTDFEQAVDALADKLQRPAGADLDYAAWVKTMGIALDEARRAETAREGLKGQLARIDTAIRRLEPDLKRDRDELNAYLQQYGCADAEALKRVVEASTAKRQLREKMGAIEETLRETGDGLAVETLAQEVAAGPDVDALPVEMERMDEQLESLRDRAAADYSILGALKQEFEQMNGNNSDAADYMQQAEFQLAQVDLHWNEYLRLELSNRLLQLAVEKFREKNQTGIVQRAGELFRRLTLGHYVDLVVEYDGDTPVLEAESADGKRRRVGDMSDGTRDQLYLALRIAFVEQHISSAGAVPLVMDDILVHFDDDRTKATLEVLQELAGKTQILYFTHHNSVVEAAVAMARAVEPTVDQGDESIVEPSVEQAKAASAEATAGKVMVHSLEAGA